MILAAVVLLAAAVAEDPAARARASEEAAFAAVDQKRWCDALALFLDSDRLVPSPDLIFNAAQAAELGADRARAMQLYTQLLGTTTSAERKAEAKKRIAALTKVVEKTGPGTPCPVPAGPDASAVASVPATTTPALPAAPVAEVAPAPAPPPSPWPWATAGVGAAAVVAGAVIVVVGLQPFFAHGTARAALLEAEKQGSTEGIDVIYEEQERARAEWVGFGQASVAAGIAFTAVGALAATGGAVWALTEGGGT